MNEEFYIGQIFENEYSPEAAIWCNEQQTCHIEEIEPQNETRRFQIVANPEPTEEEIKQRRIDELQEYLSSTDWYAVRFAETGVEIPEEIKQKRQEARGEISSLREEIKSEEESANIEQTVEEPVIENITTEESANIEQTVEEPVVDDTTA